MNNDEQHTEFTSSQHHHPNGSNYESLAAKKRKNLQTQPPNSSKKHKLTDPFLTKIDEIMPTLKTTKKRGRPKGSKKKPNPEITAKFTQATLFYALGQHQKSIPLLKQVILLAPNFSEAYHTLGLIYEQTGDNKTATDFFMLAAHLVPKGNAELWKRIVALSLQLGNTSQAIHCLSKAIKADPNDVGLRLDRAGFHVEFGEYLKAAKAYRAVVSIRPDNVYARKMAAKMYHRCNRVENSIRILEEYVKGQSSEGENDISVVYLLASLHMEKGNYTKALEMIEYVGKFQKEMPAHLKVVEGICQIRLGKVEDAEVMFGDLQMECLEDAADYVTKIADTLMDLGRHEVALKYYSMIEGDDGEKGPLYCKIAHCYQSLMKTAQAIDYLYKALQTEEDNTDARLTLASLLIEEEKEDEAISVLSPPKNLKSTSCTSKPWWVKVEVKLELAKIYHGKGMTEEFVGAIFQFINETLMVESSNRKVRKKNKLTRSILSVRVKVLDDNHTDSVFRHRPKLAPCELQKAVRAKKALEKTAALEDTDHSDDEFQQELKEPPLPKLLKDSEYYQLIIDLSKALVVLRRYQDALQIIRDALRLTENTIPLEKKEELHSLAARIAHNTKYPSYAYDYVRYNVQKHPDSTAAWNCYYKVFSRLKNNRLSKHFSFLRTMRHKHQECVQPKMISGHQLSITNQHQAAATEYLKAYKLQQENPLINLCVGTALINLALGYGLPNKHQCLAQGFAFLYNNMSLCGNSQEALYNIGRACHHVGLVTLAVSYYEKVLEASEKGHPMPNLFNKDSSLSETCEMDYCNLRREAAYNLHLIYKQSGALDLARQVLIDHCTL